MKKKATMSSLEDFHGLELLVGEVVRKQLVPIAEKIDRHQKIVDSYIKQTLGWHEEQIILTARVDRISTAMIKKNLTSPEELAI